MVMAASACVPRQRLARSAGGVVALAGAMAMQGGFMAAALENSGPNFGPPRHTDASDELTVAAVGATAFVIGAIVLMIAGPKRKAPSEPARR